MKTECIRVLSVEDNPADARLIEEMLAESEDVPFDLVRVDRLSAAHKHLISGGIDLVLLDLTLPDMHGLYTLMGAAKQSSDVPIVVLTGLDDEALAVAAAQMGVQDYVVKSDMGSTSLRRSIRCAHERHRLRMTLCRRMGELEKSEERFVKLISANADAIIVTDQEGCVQFANPAAETMLGPQTSDLRSTPLGSPTAALGEIAEIDVTRPGGLQATVEMRVVETEWEGEHAYLTTLHDVTAHKRAQAALSISEAAYRAIFEGANDAIFLVNADTGDIVSANKKTSEMFGDIIDGPSPVNMADLGADLTPFHTREDTQQRIHMAAEGEHQIFEWLVRGKDAHAFWVEANLKRVAINGSPRLLAVVRDIENHKQVEHALAERTRELKHANEDLVHRNAELDEFTCAASHDLQEPLRKLVAFCKLLPDDLGSDLPTLARTDLNHIVDAAVRMQMFVQDLLSLSRAGREELSYARVSLDECADLAVDALSVRIQETGAEITRDKLPSVWGDRTRLIQLYQNLIGNALKFRRDGKPILHLTAERQEGRLMLGVKDNGIGIKPEYASRIFAPFKRLHGTSEYPGSGIGLAICRKVVERHGGEIWVESEPGKGSHFRFFLNGHHKETP